MLGKEGEEKGKNMNKRGDKIKKVKAISIMGFVALIAAMMVITPAAAFEPGECDIYVHSGESIDAAVDSATDGQTVCVYNGTYGGRISFHNAPNVTLKGEGADVVTWDGGSGDKIVIGDYASDASGTILEGLTIKGAVAGADLVKPTAPDCIIRNCVFEGGGSGWNYGLQIAGSNTTFMDNVISNATAKYAALDIRIDCTIVNNTIMGSTQAAGISLDGASAANCIITKNNLISNAYAGIELYNAGSGNKMYLNNFVDNGKTVTTSGKPAPSVTYWNSTEQITYTYDSNTYTNYMGNYWAAAYGGTDTTPHDGIGDTTYAVPDGLGEDYRPLMEGYENYPEAAAPTPTHEVYFEPANVSASYCETTDVGIRINSDDALLSGNAVFEYIYGCANVTGFTGNTTIWNVTCSADLTVPGKVTITFATGYPAGVGPGLVHIGNLSIHCCNDTTDCDTNLTWDTAASFLYDKAGPTLVEPVEWVNGTINCTAPAAAAAIVTSLIITPDTGITGQVSAYDIIVNTTGFKSLTVNIPAGFSAKTPSGGNPIARADLWWNNESEPYYGYVTFTANTSEPSDKMDVYADIGGLTAMYQGMAVNYSEGATASIKSPFGSHLERANLTLPTESANGSLTISGLPDTITNVTVSIGAFVQNPTTAGDYTFTAKAEGEAAGKSAAVAISAPAVPGIIDYAPVSAAISDTEGAARTFNVTVNQTVNVSWLVNGTVVKDTEEGVTEASYTNTSAVIGIWNVSAIASNTNGTVMQTWIWTVEAPSPCFIATAAYGTSLHEDIDVLRDFRDERLMTNPLGRTLVKTYYETSPPIADALREHEGLRTAVREGLIKPLVYVSRMFVEEDGKH